MSNKKYILCCQLIDKIYKHSQQVRKLKLNFDSSAEEQLSLLELQMVEYLNDLEKLEQKI